MKKLQRRAYSALLVALCLLFGTGVYVWRFAAHGRDWTGFSGNAAVYENGRVLTGTITDRNGLVLADVEDGKRVFAEDEAVRTACVHVVGDREGNIGTGALRLFAEQLSAYSPVTGLAAGGGTVTLSVDAALQTEALSALGDRAGAVALMDYKTGEILCMVSSPAFDPDAGIDETDKRYDGAYLNRCISAAYPPGSVFKLLTCAAAIENIPDLFERRFDCAGSITADGNQIRCTGVHGSQTIEQALANSCNCAFASLALELGGETLSAYAGALGLSGQLSLNGAAASPGRFDAAPDGSAALAWSGVGQSTDLVCPLAMLRLSAAIANGGAAAEPTLLSGEKTNAKNIMSTDTADRLKGMMNYNVVSAYGEWNFPGLRLCAKSGTAEVGDGTAHAWFTGFLDDAEHPYAFVVVIESGGSGARNAGPVANTILQKAITLSNGETDP
jgi:peptidoglycan glycosyltransferase